MIALYILGYLAVGLLLGVPAGRHTLKAGSRGVMLGVRGRREDLNERM